MKIDWENIPTIQANRVFLRALTQDDRAALYAIYSDAEVMRFWGGAPMKNPREANDLLAEVNADLRLRKCIQWGIGRRGDDRIIGTFALFGWDPVARKCEVGFALGRAYWGMGYMLEALQAACGFIFNELDLRRIEADVDPRNFSSIRLLERLGFQKEGYLRERWLVPGETQDSLFYGLLKREWRDSGLPYQVVPRHQSPNPITLNQTKLAFLPLRRWAAAILAFVSS